MTRAILTPARVLCAAVLPLLALPSFARGGSQPLLVDDFSQHGTGYPAITNLPFPSIQIYDTGISNALGGSRQLLFGVRTTAPGFDPQTDHATADIVTTERHNAIRVTSTAGAVAALSLKYGEPVPDHDLNLDLRGTTAVRLVFSAINVPGNGPLGYTVSFDKDAGSTPDVTHLLGVVPTLQGNIPSTGPQTFDVPVMERPDLGLAGLEDVDVLSVSVSAFVPGASFQLDRIELIPEPSILPIVACLGLVSCRRRSAPARIELPLSTHL